jgi:hypothetical protein
VKVFGLLTAGQCQTRKRPPKLSFELISVEHRRPPWHFSLRQFGLIAPSQFRSNPNRRDRLFGSGRAVLLRAASNDSSTTPEAFLRILGDSGSPKNACRLPRWRDGQVMQKPCEPRRDRRVFG